MTLEEENGAFYFSQTLTEINLTRNEEKKNSAEFSVTRSREGQRRRSVMSRNLGCRPVIDVACVFLFSHPF